MDVFEALRNRYTCRDFKPQPVPQATLLEVLEAAGRSPSWANTQPWEIFVAGGESLKRIRKSYMEQFDRGYAPHPDLPAPAQWPAPLRRRSEELMGLHTRQYFIHPGDAADSRQHLRHNYMFFEAPAVIYLCMDRSLTAWSVFDLGILTQSILLAARDKGLDTAPAYMLVAYPDILRQELGIPEALSIIFGIAVGYGSGTDGPGEFRSPRRPIGEVARFNGFDEGDGGPGRKG